MLSVDAPVSQVLPHLLLMVFYLLLLDYHVPSLMLFYFLVAHWLFGVLDAFEDLLYLLFLFQDVALLKLLLPFLIQWLPVRHPLRSACIQTSPSRRPRGVRITFYSQISTIVLIVMSR